MSASLGKAIRSLVSIRCAVGILTASSCCSLSADWPRFLGPNGDNTSPETGLLDQWPETGPKVVWHKPFNGYAAPSILEDKLVLHHRVGDEEVVERMDASTGKSQWRYAYPTAFVDPYGYNNGPRAAPLLTPDRCYTFGAEGKLLCLDFNTGKKIWERDTGKDWKIPSAFFGVGSTPILEDGKLIVMVGGQPNSGVVALNPDTGKTIWESVGEKNWDGKPKIGWPGEPWVQWKSWDKQASYSSPVAADIHGERHLFCFMRQGLVSLNPANGDVRFSYWFRSRAEESVNAINPVVVDDMVFISGAYYGIGSVVLKVNPDGKPPEEVWRSQALEMHWATPVYHNGYLYAFSGRNEPDARFRCVEFKTGKVMWDRDESWNRYGRPGAPDTYGRGSLIKADGKLIALGEAGLLGLFKLNPRRPVEISRFQVPNLKYPSWAGPVLSDGKLYLRSEEHLVCLDIRGDGQRD